MLANASKSLVLVTRALYTAFISHARKNNLVFYFTYWDMFEFRSIRSDDGCRARSEWRWLMNGDEMAAERLMKTEIDTEMM